MIKIQDLKSGDFFKRKEISKKVYTRKEFDKSEKKYVCGDESDISNYLYLKKDTLVFVDFEY